MSDPAVIVPASRLAKCLGLTPRRLNQLVEEGVLQRAGAGFDLEATVRVYCDWLRRDEAMQREKRSLLRAQTAATQARALRHAGVTFTRDEIVKALRDPIADLWNIRVAVSWHRTRLLDDGRIPPDAVDQLCGRQHRELCGLIVQVRNRFESLFPRPGDMDDGEGSDGEPDEPADE
jgi:hypothetical protein